MRLQAFKVITSMLFAALVSVACGGNGSPADPPTGLKVDAYESSAVVSFDAKPGTEYWLFYAPTSLAPKDNSNMNKWFNIYGGAVQLNVTSPVTVSGLSNGISYSFTVNARTGGGPGGPAANTVTGTPRLAGTSWNSATTTTTQDIRGMAYGTKIVAVGAGGAITTSADVLTWANAASPTTANLNGAAYWATSDGISVTTTNFLAVGDAGTVLLSTDAATWTAKTSGTTRNLNAVANNGLGLNVAVGDGGTIIHSTDGVTWIAATSVASTENLYNVRYIATQWYALGANGTVLKSSDGLTWAALATGATTGLRDMAFGSYTVTSGLTTTTSLSYVLVGDGGQVLTSADATTWTSQNLPGATRLNGVVFGAQFVAVGDGGKIYTSPDGAIWTDVSSASFTNNLLTLLRGSTFYIAGGTGGATRYSR